VEFRREGPAVDQEQAPHSRHGTDDQTGGLAPVRPGGTPLVAHPGAAAAALVPPAVEDEPNAANLPEGALDLGEQE
jgi:hypothetical protein